MSARSFDPAFDAFADDYDAALARGISVSGEDKTYFAEGRLRWLAGCLEKLGERPRDVMDFGCGTGTATPYFRSLLGAERILGLDISPRSLEVARRRHALPGVRFELVSEHRPAADLDLVFSNGIFHHIPPPERSAALEHIHSSLRPGGHFALWENNPWNPGTRYVMWRIPFDRDAVPLSAPEARRLTGAAGFEVLRTDFLFIFPRLLKALRGLEPRMSPLPFGAQYQVLLRKP